LSSIQEQMEPFFNPNSIAIVGASRESTKPGHVIFRNFLENRKRGNFKGQVFPVNPTATEILGARCYDSIVNVPSDVEAIVVAVKAELVPNVLEDAARKGVMVATIISGGFSEVGNVKLEDEVKQIAKRAAIRVIGPNGVGVYDAYTGVDTIFLPETKTIKGGIEVVATPRPMAGNISFVTQSGAFGVTFLDYMAGREMGVSKFVGYGNKIDIGEIEMLEYLVEDERTKVVLLYTEGIQEGRRFISTASRVVEKKPVVVLKVGRTKGGARAAASHTGALSGDDRIYEAVFKQAGVIRAMDTEEFADIGNALAYQPPPSGDKVAVLTDGGGVAVMATDVLELLGVTVKRLSDETLKRFDELKAGGEIPAFAPCFNPVDLTGSVTGEMYEKSLKILMEDREVDGVIVLALHHVPTLQEDFVDNIVRVSKQYRKPLVACDVGEAEMARRIRFRFEKSGIPAYPTPERASKAMYGLIEYGRFLRRRGVYERYLSRLRSQKPQI